MKTEDLNAIHQNPNHWHLVFFYFSPQDPRIVVRKRIGIGWTINFARPLALPFLAALIAFAYGYMELLSQIELSDTAKWLGVIILIFGITTLCSWMSRR